MLSIRDYAKERSISYEAARKTVNKYAKELEGHIIKQGKKQFLDAEGEEILDKHRMPKETHVTVETAKGPTYDDLKDTIIQLQHEKEVLYQKMLAMKDEIREGIEAKTQLAYLESGKKELEASNKTLSEKNNQLQAQVVLMDKELKSYSKWHFGFFRKVNV